MTFVAYLDEQLLLGLNALSDHKAMQLWWLLGSNSLVRELTILCPLVALWFAGDSKRQSRMLAGLLGVCVATLLSVWSQFHLHIHTRPFPDPALPLKVAIPEWVNSWEQKNSFPSDTATLFFGLATVVFLENRWVGLFCLFWTTSIIAIPRIAFGWHYPSDVAGAAVLGPGMVLVFENISYLRVLVDRTVSFLFDKRMYILHGLLFVFLAEVTNLFAGVAQYRQLFCEVVAKRTVLARV